jgi:hypothetical protein
MVFPQPQKNLDFMYRKFQKFYVVKVSGFLLQRDHLPRLQNEKNTVNHQGGLTTSILSIWEPFVQPRIYTRQNFHLKKSLCLFLIQIHYLKKNKNHLFETL